MLRTPLAPFLLAGCVISLSSCSSDAAPPTARGDPLFPPTVPGVSADVTGATCGPPTHPGGLLIDRVDTRALTRHIRDHGAQAAVIGTSSPEALVAKAKAAPSMAGQDLTGAVTTREP